MSVSLLENTLDAKTKVMYFSGWLGFYEISRISLTICGVKVHWSLVKETEYFSSILVDLQEILFIKLHYSLTW